MLDKTIIIFSGFNQRAVVAFLRTLKAKRLSYAIIAKSNDDTIFQTDYKTNVLTTRKSVPLVFDDLLARIKEVQKKMKANKYVIAPSSEALNRFLLQRRMNFEDLGCEIPLVDKELYELISDKYSFYQLCQQHKICVPKKLTLGSKFSLPIVAKPKNYFSSLTGEILSPVILQNASERDEFFTKYNVKDFYFQEFVHGKSFYLLYYFHRNGNLFKFSQKNIAQQPEGKSIVSAVSSNFHHSGESFKYEQLFKTLKFFGLVMVEVKQDGGKYCMIEANPRFWGPSQLFVDAGMNFFEAFLHDFGVSKTLPLFLDPKKKFKYFWFGGVLETLKQQKQLTYYHGNEINLMDELPLWLQSDVYRRIDAFDVFKKELF